MSQFVVGQWVECVEKVKSFDVTLEGFYRVKSIREGTNDIYLEGGGKMSWSVDRFRTVEWQVGRTYKTTMEGVTATIERESERFVYAAPPYWTHPTQSICGYEFHKTTGLLCTLEDRDDVPHLTPYLADEPSPAVETTEPSKSDEPHPAPSRYHRTINGATLDLYDVAEAYGIDSHRIFHAVKKLVMAGRRGHKDREQDLREAIVSIESELRKMKGGVT